MHTRKNTNGMRGGVVALLLALAMPASAQAGLDSAAETLQLGGLGGGNSGSASVSRNRTTEEILLALAASGLAAFALQGGSGGHGAATPLVLTTPTETKASVYTPNASGGGNAVGNGSGTVASNPSSGTNSLTGGTTLTSTGGGNVNTDVSIPTLSSGNGNVVDEELAPGIRILPVQGNLPNVPEPGVILLSVGALLGGGVFLRRRR